MGTLAGPVFFMNQPCQGLIKRTPCSAMFRCQGVIISTGKCVTGEWVGLPGDVDEEGITVPKKIALVNKVPGACTERAFVP